MAEASRGRPREGVEAKRVPLSFRTTQQVRDYLDEAARSSGRSLAQEVEYRLSQFGYAEELLGGSGTARVLRAAANVIDAVESRSGKSWLEDYWTAISVQAAIERLLRAYSPLEPHASQATSQPSEADVVREKERYEEAKLRYFRLAPDDDRVLSDEESRELAALNAELNESRQALYSVIAGSGEPMDNYRRARKAGDSLVGMLFDGVEQAKNEKALSSHEELPDPPLEDD